jgi:Arc/MetJ-type ribon-helix-helix transcriptional regulator
LENERITLRLDADDLRLIDGFIAGSNEFSNRSQLARAAIRAYIDAKIGCAQGAKKQNEVVVELPPLVLDTIAHFVAEGVYNSMSEALVDCARHQFLHAEHVEALKKDANQQRSTVKFVPKA